MNRYLFTVATVVASCLAGIILLRGTAPGFRTPTRPIASAAPLLADLPPAQLTHVVASVEAPPAPTHSHHPNVRQPGVTTEGEIEPRVQTLRTDVARVPDGSRQAFLQEVLRALEEEWGEVR